MLHREAAIKATAVIYVLVCVGSLDVMALVKWEKAALICNGSFLVGGLLTVIWQRCYHEFRR